MDAYRFSVPNGNFNIVLHFAEIYHQAVNKRLLSVALEGVQIIQNLDIYQLAGHDFATTLSFNTQALGIPVTDNRLDLTFSSTKDEAKISAIEIISQD